MSKDKVVKNNDDIIDSIENNLVNNENKKSNEFISNIFPTVAQVEMSMAILDQANKLKEVVENQKLTLSSMLQSNSFFVSNTKNLSFKDYIDNQSKKQYKFYVFDIFDNSESSKIDSYCKEKFGETICAFGDSFSKDNPVEYTKTIENIKLNISEISKINLHFLYSYGDYFFLIWECFLDIENKNKDTIADTDGLNKRFNVFVDAQKDLESNIPKELNGILKKRIVSQFEQLPSVYVYNFSDVSFHSDSGLQLPSSDRDKGDCFINNLTDFDDDEKDYSGFFGVSSNHLISVIPYKEILAMKERYIRHKTGSLPSQYICFWFDNDDETLNSLILDLTRKLGLLFILKEIELVLDTQGTLLSEIKIEEISKHKDQIIQSNNQYISVSDYFSIYSEVKIKLDENEFLFKSEKVYSRHIGSSGYDKSSISNEIGNWCNKVVEKINRQITQLDNKFKFYFEEIRHQDQLNALLPTINPLFQDIAPELIVQIKKWENRIDQRDLEKWLANFKTKDQKLLALKLLDKLQFVKNKDLSSFLIACNNEVNSKVGDNKKRYSVIGELTSGSHHIVKKYQEENKLKHTEFTELDKIIPDKDTILILVDDFIGSGDTFVGWYSTNKQRLSEFKQVIYACPIALEKGVVKITEQTDAIVVCSWELNSDCFFSEDQKDSEEIRKFIDSYSSRIPTNILWGYDNCKALLTFEDNVPNNTIGLFWCSKNWIPLLGRK